MDYNFYVIFVKDHTQGVCGYYHGNQRKMDKTPKLYRSIKFAERDLSKFNHVDGLFGTIIKAKLVPEVEYGV